MEIPAGKIHIVKLKPQRGKQAYYYARKVARVNGKPKVVWSFPLGTAENIVKQFSNRVLSHIEFQSFSFGIPSAFLAIAEMTDFFNIVDATAPKKMIGGAFTTSQYLLAMMTGRATGPLSKAETGRKFSDTFLNLVWKPVHQLNTQNFCNHMDRLTGEAVNDIAEKFGAKLVSMGMRPSIVLWDTSNFSTNIENWGDKELPKTGYAKDKHFEKNLIGTGIALSDNEIPLYHMVYPGNENDAQLFNRSINDIVAKVQKICGFTDKLTIVFDKGNNSEENIRNALENCHVIGSISFDSVPDLLDIPLDKFKFLYRTKTDTEMKGYRTRRNLWNYGEFDVVVTHNSQTEKKQTITWMMAKAKIEKELNELKKKFEKKEGKGRRMSVKGLTTRINQVIPRQYRAVYWWNIEGKEKRFDWKLLPDKEETLKKKFGKNVIFSDLKASNTKKIVKTFHSKYKVEKAFKWLHGKLLIPIPPIYHDKDERIRVHIFLCVMALTFVRLIQKQLKDISVSDEKLLDELRNLKVALIKDTRTDEIQLKVAEMTPIQAAVFSQLGLHRYLSLN